MSTSHNQCSANRTHVIGDLLINWFGTANSCLFVLVYSLKYSMLRTVMIV